MQLHNRERGAVSIFLVIFFALLIGVITISFIGIVIRENVQSTNNDLSRSAYDSAQAGVEDAKRAIASYAMACSTGSSACSSIENYFSSSDCTAFKQFAVSNGVVVPAGSNDVPVQGSTNATFDQAYTCVNVTMDTPDYLNSVTAGSSDIVPLKGTSGFDGVSINWFNHTDGGLGETSPFDLRAACTASAATGSDCQLPEQGAWGSGTPAVLRVQLISYNGTITDAGLQNSSRTLFLYPTNGGTYNANFDSDGQPASASNGPSIVPVHCNTTGTYACRVNLGLGGAAGSTTFLRVTPLYKKSTFQVQLTAGGATGPLFSGVQPLVDSTGRANDLFRRVQARVRLQNNALYPEYAVDSQNSFCKDYGIGSSDADFQNNCN